MLQCGNASALKRHWKSTRSFHCVQAFVLVIWIGYIMIDLLMKSWRENLKLTNDPVIFKVVLCLLLILFSAVFGLLEYMSLRERNLIGIIILLTSVLQYNKHIIIANITNPGKNSFCAAGRKTFLRFCLFQIMKANMLIPAAVVLTAVVSVSVLFTDLLMFAAVWVILAAEIGIYCISYRIEKNRRYRSKGTYAPLWPICGRHRILYSNLAFLLRQPLREYCEMILELCAALLCVYYGVSPIMVNYFIIVFCVLDIEVSGDRNMGHYSISYGKFAFQKTAGLSKLQKFRLSDEYRIFLKYLIIEIGFIGYGGYSVLCFLLLIFTLAYRYYCGYERVLEARTLFRNTAFRMCMFYFILVAIVPFLFEKEMYRVFADYKQEYGVLYFSIVSLVMLFIPAERFIKVNGEHIDES